MATVNIENQRVLEPRTGRKGDCIKADEFNHGCFIVKWDDGTEGSVWTGNLLDLNQGALDRFIAGGGYVKDTKGRSDGYLNLKDVDAEAARIEAAAGNPVVTS